MDGDKAAKQILKFVSGGAGVGKSKLIEVMTEGVEKLYGRNAVVLSAPTGMAAQNIGGRTMHGVFRLPVHTKRKWAYRQLFPEQAKLMYDEIGKAKLILIDEISMVSNVILAFVHMRLSEMCGSDPGVPFGGCNVVVLGDLMQLPPIGEKGLSAPQVYRAMGGESMKKVFPGTVMLRFPVSLWRNFEYAELTENMRQAEDKSYAELLNEVRMGKLTDETKRVLDERLVEVGHDVDERAKFMMKKVKEGENPLCLMSMRKDVAAMNLCMLYENDVTPVMLHAIDKSIGRKKAKVVKMKGKSDKDIGGMKWKELQKCVEKATKRKEQETGGLADVIVMGVGARVMLRKNVDVAKGQYNGALGVVTRIVLNNRMPDGVSAVMVKFDSIEEMVEVKRVTATYHLGQAIEVKREQFPLALAYAMTIHKSQGLSLDSVVCDLKTAIFACGMSYVVLSRVRKLSGLYMFGFDASSVKCDRLAVIEYNRLRATIGLPLFEVPPVEVVEKKKVLKRSLDMDMLGENDMPVTKKAKVDGPSVVPKPLKRVVVPRATDSDAEYERCLKEREKGAESSQPVVVKKILPKKSVVVRCAEDDEYARYLEESDRRENGKVVEKAKDVSGKFVPLRNPRYQCYANSAIQALLSCGRSVESWVFEEGCDRVGQLLRPFFEAKRSGMKGKRWLEAKELVQYARATRNRQESDYGERDQHDSSEFLIGLLRRSEQLEVKFWVRKEMKYRCTVCGLESDGNVERTWDCGSVNLNDSYGSSVSFDRLWADYGVEFIEKACVLCQEEYVRHEQKVTVEVLPETENVILRIGRHVNEGRGDEMVPRLIECAIEGFDPDNVMIGDLRMEVSCAVVYTGSTGKSGHYYVYVRSDNGMWWKISDETKVEERKFVEGLVGVTYLILQRRV